MTVLPIYAPLLALLFVYLSVRVIRLRRKLGVADGDGGDGPLRRALAAYTNFVEYVPMALVVIGLQEATVGQFGIHALCAGLLASRVLHAYGTIREGAADRLRTIGMVGTFACTLLPTVALLAVGFVF